MSTFEAVGVQLISPGRGLIWDVEGALRLRKCVGIVGTLVGTLPEFTQQNIAKGLPLLLSQEELALGLRQRWLFILPPPEAPPRQAARREVSPNEGSSFPRGETCELSPGGIMSRRPAADEGTDDNKERETRPDVEGHGELATDERSEAMQCRSGTPRAVAESKQGRREGGLRDYGDGLKLLVGGEDHCGASRNPGTLKGVSEECSGLVEKGWAGIWEVIERVGSVLPKGVWWWVQGQRDIPGRARGGSGKKREVRWWDGRGGWEAAVLSNAYVEVPLVPEGAGPLRQEVVSDGRELKEARVLEGDMMEIPAEGSVTVVKAGEEEVGNTERREENEVGRCLLIGGEGRKEGREELECGLGVGHEGGGDVHLFLGAGELSKGEKGDSFDGMEGFVVGDLGEVERRRRAVFADLHRRGFTLTSGVRFGGDFLAYPGDPSRFHSRFTVRVVGEGEAVPRLVKAAGSRVASSTRKRLVLAYVGRPGEAPPLTAEDGAIELVEWEKVGEGTGQEEDLEKVEERMRKGEDLEGADGKGERIGDGKDLGRANGVEERMGRGEDLEGAVAASERRREDVVEGLQDGFDLRVRGHCGERESQQGGCEEGYLDLSVDESVVRYVVLAGKAMYEEALNQPGMATKKR